MDNEKQVSTVVTAKDDSNLINQLAGWKTSEFWITVFTVAFSLIYLFQGRVSDFDETGPIIQQTSESIALLISNLAIVFRYIKSRENIKKATLEQEVKRQIQTQNNSTGD